MRMYPTMELIELQTYAISKGESIIEDSGEYKSTEDVFEILHKCWNNAAGKERDRLERILSGTPYKCK